MKNIVLIGMPCCGKTTLGKGVAKKLNLKFIDTDEFIEKKFSKSTSEIIEQKGINFFRNIEKEVIKKISTCENTIIATGGGTILNGENILNLKKNGIFIFLEREIEDILKNENFIKNRPLLKNKDDLYRLYNERIELYEKYKIYRVQNKNFDNSLLKLCEIIENIKKEKRFCVIGNPVLHSLSPIIHKEVFSKITDNANYSICEINQNEFDNWIENINRNKINGFNITMPYKKAIMEKLNFVSENALIFACSNTVKVENGTLKGYNTDCDGFFESLYDIGFDFNNKNVIILGSGAVANALIIAMKNKNVSTITVAARSPKTLDSKLFQQQIHLISFDYDEISKACKNADILINCTPIGMSKTNSSFDNPYFLKSLNKNALIYDLIYFPQETQLIKEAKKLGLTAYNGLSMLIYQAIIADELFFDIKLNKKYFYEECKVKVIKELERRAAENENCNNKRS